MIDEVTNQSLDLRQLLPGPNKSTWRTSLANNLGRLTQDVGTCMPCGTNTVFFLPKSSVPSNCKVTYARMVATIRPHKNKVNRVHVNVNDDILDYPGATTTNCSSLATKKCLLKITISTPDAQFMMLNIQDFYYGNPHGPLQVHETCLGFLP